MFKTNPVSIKINKTPMKNITINIPDVYDRNIQKLISLKILPSRSESIRLALKEFLQAEYTENLDLLDFFNTDDIIENPEIEKKKINAFHS